MMISRPPPPAVVLWRSFNLWQLTNRLRDLRRPTPFAESSQIKLYLGLTQCLSLWFGRTLLTFWEFSKLNKINWFLRWFISMGLRFCFYRRDSKAKKKNFQFGNLIYLESSFRFAEGLCNDWRNFATQNKTIVEPPMNPKQFNLRLRFQIKRDYGHIVISST